MHEAHDPAIRRLLTEVIDSIEKLELVLHLRRGSSTIPELTAQLGLPEPMVAEAVTALIASGVASKQIDRTIRYVAENPQHAVLVALAKLYDDDRIVVLRLITQISIERVRSEAARVFADAFVFRAPKKPKGEPDA